MTPKKLECFVHFLKGILQWEPSSRYTPAMALQHPFITGLEFDPSFTPIPDSVKDASRAKKQQYVHLMGNCVRDFVRSRALRSWTALLLLLRLRRTKIHVFGPT